MLAIVVPYYKARYFEETIESLVNQTDLRFNLYIGNDASPEDPSTILDRFRNFPFTYRFFEQNLGGKDLVAQWERCLSMLGSEEWVMILGDDDILDENAVASFYRHSDKIQNCNVVRFATVKINGSGIPISQVFTHPETERSTDFLFRDSRSSLGEYCFRREILLRKGMHHFPLAWYSDLMMVLEISGFGNVYSINEAVVKIRISSHSISGSKHLFSQKAQAKAEYYLILCGHYLRFFSETQQSKLLKSLSKTYLDDKSNLRLFKSIMLLHLKFGRIGQIARLWVDMIKSLKK